MGRSWAGRGLGAQDRPSAGRVAGRREGRAGPARSRPRIRPPARFLSASRPVSAPCRSTAHSPFPPYISARLRYVLVPPHSPRPVAMAAVYRPGLR